MNIVSEKIWEEDLLDDDGYPTDYALNIIKNWDVLDFEGLAVYIKSMWRWEACVKWDGKVLELHTGGWSGNEDLIEALPVIWNSLYCYSWRRGGHYIFVKSPYGEEL